LFVLTIGGAKGQFIRKDKIDWVFTIGLSQSAINDWKQGEVSGFEFSSSLNLRTSFHLDSLFLLRLNFRYAMGVQYASNKDNDFDYFMPTDNLLFGETVFVYPVGWKLDPCVSAQFTTQFVESYKYVKGERVRTASLWDPVTSIETFGFEFSDRAKDNFFTSRLGLSLKQIRANEFTKMTDDFKTRDIKERYKTQTGIQWKSDTKIRITDALTYRGTLGLFGAFEDLTKWTFAMTNQFDIKVFKAIGVTININLAYNERQKCGLQYTQNLRFGFIVSPH
jgi:hypothetical protein